MAGIILVGALVFLVNAAYLLTAGDWLAPAHVTHRSDLETIRGEEFLTEVIVGCYSCEHLTGWSTVPRGHTVTRRPRRPVVTVCGSSTSRRRRGAGVSRRRLTEAFVDPVAWSQYMSYREI